MVEWVEIEESQIRRVGYNPDVKTMFIDFLGSTVDTPYRNVPEKIFREFSQSEKIDDYYVNYIKACYEKVNINNKY